MKTSTKALLATLAMVVLIAGAPSGSQAGPAVSPAPADPAASFAKAPIPSGWTGETRFGPHADWEPNVAADPNSPYVYMVTTEYSGPMVSCKNCPYGALILRVSSDGGNTFGAPYYICKCAGENWQADPVLSVAGNGDLYAVWLTNHYSTVVARSTDHGATWSLPVDVAPSMPWTDHAWMVAGANGLDVYVGFSHADNFMVTSHDGGLTWSDPIKTNTDRRYFFPESAVVLPDGTIVFSVAAYGCCPYYKNAIGKVQLFMVRSTDNGASWQQIRFAKAPPMPFCNLKGCPLSQWGPLDAVAADAQGHLMVAYNASTTSRGPQRMWVRRSADEGSTWGPATALSPARVHGRAVIAEMPTIAGTGNGDFRLWWADDRNGEKRFNIWYRETSNGGSTWSPVARLSNRGDGAGYKHPAGFPFAYGDYGGIAITNAGKTFAVWGEGGNWYGNGNTWFSVQT